MRILLALAVLMAWVDPYVLWQAGYWLSFIAVALLLKYDDTLHRQSTSHLPQSHQQSTSHNTHNTNKSITSLTRIWLTGKRIFKLQFWLFIALLPITLLLFGKASLWGLIINLFAIGLFGWIIVPLNLLAGLCYLLLPTLADSIWALVSIIVASLHEWITWLTSLPALSGAWLYTPVNMAILLMALMAMLPWLLPRGLLSRWLVLPPLALLMMTVYANQQSLSMTPTLYVLPTGDHYISAAVLKYPISDTKGSASGETYSAADNVSWLFLADHRLQNTRTMVSTLTADNLSATLEQQLRTLSIKRLEGIVIQTSTPSLTDTLSKPPSDQLKTNNALRHNTQASELLPMTVLKLSQSLPTNQYWQAGRHERWSNYQQLYASNQSPTKTTISAQHCDQGKTWQLSNEDLMLQAMTGWSEIEDSSVWDCSIAIDSGQTIAVVQYDAANPQQPLPLKTQNLTAEPVTLSQPLSKKMSKPQPMPEQNAYQTKGLQSRLVLDAATHQRVWQLWPLICPAESLSADSSSSVSIQWLAHNASQVSAEVLSRQHVTEVISYDGKDLEVALSLRSVP